MKDLFKDIKTRLLSHKSDMDLDSAWASLKAHRDKAQKKNHFRLASVLLLLLWIGGCGSWIWVKNMEKHAPQTAQQQRPSAVAPPPPVGQPALMLTNKTAEHKYHGDNLEVVTRDIPKRPTRDLSHAKGQSLSFFPNTESATSNGIDESLITGRRTDKTLIENNPIDLQTSPVVQVPPDQATGITRNLPPSLLMLAQRDLGLLGPKPSHLNLPTPYNTQTPEKPAKQKATHATAIYVGGGWLTTKQQFRDSEGQSTQGAALRNQTEQPLPSFTFHAGVQRCIGKGRLLDFGVHYDQWYDHLDYTFENPHTYQYNNVLLSIRRLEATGSEVMKYGNTAVDGTQKVHALYYNRYSSINLRLALVQSIYHKGRWDIALGAGMNASLWAQAEGLVSAPDPVQGTYELNKIYKNAFGVGINALTRLTYGFNEHYALQLTPSATWGFSNVLNTTSPLQSRLRQYSATAGLVYKF